MSATAVLSILAARFEERIQPNVFVGVVPVGNLSRHEAMKRLRIWWESEKRNELTLVIPDSRGAPLKATPGKLGITIDDVVSIESLPLDSFWDNAQRAVIQENRERRTFPLRFKSNGQSAQWLAEAVEAQVGSPAPAKVAFENGRIVRTPEIAGSTLDESKLAEAVLDALTNGKDLVVPVRQSAKRVPDEALHQIVEVVSEFSTRFPRHQTARNSNLNLASKAISGTILMPGETWSFNGHLGPRTVAKGYREAGVYVNGRHDTGIGGGICQVSSTLYNAVVFANLKIVQRSNHSMPVAYLPVGRDAAVSYPSLDLKFQNTMETPIAIVRTFEPGRLGFKILGRKVPGQEVRVYTTGHRSWGRGVQYVNDPSLPPGKSKVIEKGSSGHAVNAYRVVLLNGKEIKREQLNSSHYPGGKKIIAINRAPAAAPPSDGQDGSAPQAEPEPSIPNPGL